MEVGTTLPSCLFCQRQNPQRQPALPRRRNCVPIVLGTFLYTAAAVIEQWRHVEWASRMESHITIIACCVVRISPLWSEVSLDLKKYTRYWVLGCPAGHRFFREPPDLPRPRNGAMPLSLSLTTSTLRVPGERTGVAATKLGERSHPTVGVHQTFRNPSH